MTTPAVTPPNGGRQFNESIQTTIFARTLALAALPLLIVGIFLVALVSQHVTLANPLLWGSGAIILALVIVAGLSWYNARSITGPLRHMAETAGQIAAGEVDKRVTADTTHRNDEIGQLAASFNQMNDRLQLNMTELNKEVSKLDHEIDQAHSHLEQRAFEQETANLINQRIGPLLDVGRLNQEVVNLLQERFNFYYIALFLTNPSGNEALLSQSAGELSSDQTYKAASSTIGGRSLLNMDRLVIDGRTLMGQAATTREIRIHPVPSWQGPQSALSSGPSKVLLVPQAQAEIALPLLSGENLVGILDIQTSNSDGFSEATVTTLKALSTQIAIAIERAQLYAQTIAERDRTSLLYEINTALSAAIDMEAVLETTVSFAPRLGAEFGEVHVQTATGEIISKGSDPQRLMPWAEELVQLADLPAETLNEAAQRLGQTEQIQSVIAAPILVGTSTMTGVLLFAHTKNHRFGQTDRLMVEAVAAQVGAVLEHSSLLHDIQASLQETHLMLDISQRMVATPNNQDMYQLLVDTILATGADRCSLHLCEVDRLESPTYSDIVHAGPTIDEKAPHRFTFIQYPLLGRVVANQEAVIIADIQQESQLSTLEKGVFSHYGATTIVLTPLVAQTQVLGFVVVEYQHKQVIHERALTLFRTLCNQATIGLENARQTARTEVALAESQTLYRAGRILAKANDLQEMLEDALVEFLYTLNVEQGGIVLLTEDRQQGYLAAYVENSLPQTVDIDRQRFDIVPGIPYQDTLLAGQPFVSEEARSDPSMPHFKSFNPDINRPYAIMQAPLILQGETVGWLGADSVNKPRHFTESEVDLSRAMADQIAIAMMNRRLLEQTQRQAQQLQAVAQVGEAISEMLDLGDILNQAVELIKARLNLYHASIFVVDEAQEWAVVKASTGEIGQIMVERPHQLRVGGNSIVGYVTGHGQPRIALDVGEDAVHFKNPLLPETRSELALPLVSHGGRVIGALDVQSSQANAFTTADIEILQIMANQLTAAIEKANLFEQTEQRLAEQATLYRIGQRLAETWEVAESMGQVAHETALALQANLCQVSILVEGDQAWPHTETSHQPRSPHVEVVGEYHQPNSNIPTTMGQRYPLLQQLHLAQAHATQEVVTAVVPLPANDGGRATISLVVVPVVVRETVIALLTVGDENPRRQYNTQHLTHLNSIALQVGNALESSRLYQQAQANERFLKGILNHIPDPIFIKDKARRVVMVNEAYSRGLLGQPETALLGLPDDSWWPEGLAQRQEKQDEEVFASGLPTELEETWLNRKGQPRTLFFRKTPLYMGTSGEGPPDYLLGVISDITEQRAREVERERLMDSTAQTLRRTQALYQMSHALDTTSSLTTPINEIFETVIKAYVDLLNLPGGSIWQLDKAETALTCGAIISKEAIVASDIDTINTNKNSLFQHVQHHKAALTIKEVGIDPLTTPNGGEPFGHPTAQSMVVLPLIWRQRVQGVAIAIATEIRHFSPEELELGQTMVGQLARWLENAYLLQEAEYRSQRLQTASEVSQAASQLLDVAELMEASVYLIQERFAFYYVGMFMVEGDWAVLKAGTGEAGQQQLFNNHRLKLGGESMIGWSVEHKQARIALDVGEDAVHFKNPYLPLTRSEMALPLVSRGEAIGALTIQSTEARAFSDEDITLLQTMADQIANAIKNAQLFEQTQSALSETERLYQISQELLSADDEAVIYRLAIHAMAQAGADICAVLQPSSSSQRWRAQAAWSVRGNNPFDVDRTMASTVATLLPPENESLVVDIERPTPTPLPLELKSAVVLSLEAGNRRLGLLLVGYFQERHISRAALRFYHTLGQQLVVALENMRLLQASQKRARREEIIRHITSKIRAANTVEEILQATASELSHFVGSSQGVITLGSAGDGKRNQ